ncbi:HAD domain-containing protein [Paraburkholderia sp. EG287A]|uniref:HAD domain-containing protein n=1 Tax=Paraburkholderia sp. EG287A TaxID=3237012 RepID=UPI0034D15B9B
MQVTEFRPADVAASTPPEIAAMRHPVLFLDFDGVLHAYDELALDDGFRLIENPNLFMWCPVLEQILAPFPDVRIVISSDWRRLFDDAALIELLGPLGARFAGVVEEYGPTRAAEILAEVQRRSITRWLALDDHPSVVDAAREDPRFIVCSGRTGVASTDVQQALRQALKALQEGGAPLHPQGRTGR